MSDVNERAKAATRRIVRLLPEVPDAKVWDAIYEELVAMEQKERTACESEPTDRPEAARFPFCGCARDIKASGPMLR